MSDVVAFAALATSLFGLTVMWRQLRVAREPLARGLLLGARPRTGTVEVVNGVAQPREFEFTVEASGPGAYHDVVGAVVDEANERHTVIDLVPRLTNELGKVTGTRSMTTSEARAAMFVVTWVTGHRDGIRTNAYRIGVLGTGRDAGTDDPRTKRTGGAAGHRDRGRRPFDDEQADRTVEVFRWYRTSRWRNRLLLRMLPRLPRWGMRLWTHIPGHGRAVDRFRSSGRWRPMPPAVPVRGIWPGLRDRGRWH